MKCFVYILECKDKTFYTGISVHPLIRLKEHNLRIRSCLQKSKIPTKIVYLEEKVN